MTGTSTIQLINKLDHIARIVASSKWRRLLYAPSKYVTAIFFREIIYRLFKKGKIVDVSTFWGDDISICLPASTDIYLFGCKTHDSEIRMTRFVINNLSSGDHFLDIGAHVGYYSLLASYCTGRTGRVLSIEPAASSYSLLKTTVSSNPDIIALNIALSAKEELLEFVEFPAIYSEYNTLHASQFEDQTWFNEIMINKTTVQAMPGDLIVDKYQINPSIIKIDVEGAEHQIIEGLHNFLLENKPVVVMEFVESKRHNANHELADKQLKEMGYSAFCILADGGVAQLTVDTGEYVNNTGLESDNIVYKKTISSDL